MAKKAKKKVGAPLTVRSIAKALGVSEAAVYRTVRVEKKRKLDPLFPLFDFARRQDISRYVATYIVGIFRLEGLPALEKCAETLRHRESERGRLAALLLATTDSEIKSVIVNSEKKRKKYRSGVHARMSKAKA